MSKIFHILEYDKAIRIFILSTDANHCRYLMPDGSMMHPGQALLSKWGTFRCFNSSRWAISVIKKHFRVNSCLPSNGCESALYAFKEVT
jgi:hypothetical protein